MDFYVYVHKKKTTGEVFYVGKGCGTRAWNFNNRSTFWVKVCRKYGCVVEIVKNNLQEWYALELETDLINYYGRSNLGNGPLVNLIDGGDGLSGEASPRTDRETYTFQNVKTGEKFTGTRYQFNKVFPDVVLNGIMAGSSKTSKNWMVEGKLSEDELTAIKSGYRGEYSKRVDNCVHSFLKLSTGEIVNCTRHELLELDKNIDNPTMAGLITGEVRTYKGWAMASSLEDFSLYQLNNPVSGLFAGLADRKIYTFKNIVTSEIFEGTRTHFTEKYGIPVYSLFQKIKPVYKVHNWCLLENEDNAIRNPASDFTIYNLEHKDGDVFTGTRREFNQKYGFTFHPLVSPTKPSKICKGWRLVN